MNWLINWQIRALRSFCLKAKAKPWMHRFSGLVREWASSKKQQNCA
jgi:hypothetical protein